MALSVQAVGQELAKPRQGIASLLETRTASIVASAARLREIAGAEGDEATAQLFDDKIEATCEIHTEAEAAKQAIEQVTVEYGQAHTQDRASNPLTQRVQEGMAARLEEHPKHGHPQHTPLWQQWCSEINRDAPAGDSDDDVQIGKGGLYKNIKCTLTQKNIFELKEPVEDNLGFIWERAAIESYIRNQRGGARNPAQTANGITLQQLKPARRVMRAAEQQRRAASTQVQQTQNVEVL